MSVDVFNKYNAPRAKAKIQFNKKSFISMSLAIFGIFVFGFILITFAFSQIDFVNALRSIPLVNSSVFFVVAYFVIFFGYIFFHKRMPFWLFLIFGLAFVSLLSVTTAFVFAFFIRFSSFAIKDFLILASIPAATLFLAGLLGFWSKFPVEKLYPVIIAGFIGLLIFSLVGFFALGFSRFNLIYGIIGYLLFFLVTIIDFYVLKNKSKYVELYGDQLTFREVFRLGMESAISLFFDYIILLKFLIRFLR